MKINKNICSDTKLSELENGEVFQWSNSFYMRVNVQDLKRDFEKTYEDDIPVICLRSGRLFGYSKNALVTKLDNVELATIQEAVHED